MEELKKHPGGRPTLYNEEILSKTKEYIDACDSNYKVTSKPTVNKDGELTHVAEVKYDVNLPTIEGLAYELGINKDTIYEWRKVYDEFSELIEQLLAKQAKFLINKGLSGDYNSTIAKVLLTKHGYREGLEQTGKDGKDLIPEPLSEEDKEKLNTLLNK